MNGKWPNLHLNIDLLGNKNSNIPKTVKKGMILGGLAYWEYLNWEVNRWTEGYVKSQNIVVKSIINMGIYRWKPHSFSSFVGQLES
jgi:hypothetical protein